MKFSFKTKSLMAAMSFASLALVTGTSTAATAVQKVDAGIPDYQKAIILLVKSPIQFLVEVHQVCYHLDLTISDFSADIYLEIKRLADYDSNTDAL